MDRSRIHSDSRSDPEITITAGAVIFVDQNVEPEALFQFSAVNAKSGKVDRKVILHDLSLLSSLQRNRFLHFSAGHSCGIKVAGDRFSIIPVSGDTALFAVLEKEDTALGGINHGTVIFRTGISSFLSCFLPQLFLKTACPAAEAGMLSGFQDANYFSRVFRTRLKMTPLAFRKKVLAGKLLSDDILSLLD